MEGELGSLFRSRAGHCYFDLRDGDGSLRCVMFRRVAERLPSGLEEGQRVRVRARADVYPERGALQLIVEELRPGRAGDLRLAFERMKQRLYEEGLFAPEHKQPLPGWPRRVGVVTSAQGAALHDLARALRRRRSPVELVLFDARVQGELAWRELVRGLHLLGAAPDVGVIVLTRGGGSLEDLWSFNREELVRAIFELETPVISAVGHEVDLVLTDLVADARAATPTAAAELLGPDGGQLASRVAQLSSRLGRVLGVRVARSRDRLALLERGVIHPAQRLAAHGRRVRELGQRLDRAGHAQLASRRRALGEHGRRLAGAAAAGPQRSRAHWQALAARLDALSPLAVLGRGYALARRLPDGAILRAARDAPPGSEIEVRLAEGELRATVTGQAGSEE